MPMTQEEQYYHNLLSSIYPCKVPFTICVKNDKPKTRLGTYWPSRKHILIHTEMGLCKPERGVVLIFPKLDSKASLSDSANGSSNSSFRGLFKGILKSGKI